MAVYRNLQEQVYENAKDIEDLQNSRVTERVDILETEMDTVEGKVTTLETNTQGIEYNVNAGGLLFTTPVRITNPEGSTTIPLVRIIGETSIHADTFITANLDISGELRAHRIANYDINKNYEASIDIGNGNSGSTLHLEAPGDNGIATLELANEYNQGSTAIKFTADKLIFGNTEITEEQLQKLLALIQNQ